MTTYTHHFYTTLLLLAAGMIGAACSSSEHKQAAEVAPVHVTVGKGTLQSTAYVQASGRIAATKTAAISTRLMGFITEIKVHPGQTVRKGQLLVAIQNADIRAKQAQAQAMVSEAEAALANAEKDYKRFQELYETESASQKELENASLQYKAMQAKVEAARQMQNEAGAVLAYTHLTAPFAGTIVSKHADVGSMATPGAPILMLEKADGYLMEASVAENDIHKIQTGMNADVLVKATGAEQQGRVIEVSPSSQMNGGRYAIKIDFPQPDKTTVYSGMYAEASIPVLQPAAAGNTLYVPKEALVYHDQLTGIYTISQQQTALLRWVRTGKTMGDQVEILTGLKADEPFIVSSNGRLYNGIPVVIAAPTEGATSYAPAAGVDAHSQTSTTH